MTGTSVTKVSVVGPDGGESIPLGAIRVRILEDGGTTDHRLGVGEITVPPRTDGPPQHRHARHDEGFYVVSGTARFTVGDTDHEAPAGSFVMIPPGAPHTFANPGDETVVLLNTFTPDLYVQYFRDMRDLTATGRPDPEGAVRVMNRYATEPATEYAAVPGATPTITTTDVGGIPLTVREWGDGRPFLLLHGGAGVDSVSGLGVRLAAEHPAHTIAPIHPGFGGTPRPEELRDVRGLAALYKRMLEDRELSDVTVVGSSLGGWVAAELALIAPELVSGLILMDAAGLDSTDNPPADFFGMTLDQVFDVSYAEPDKFRIDVSKLTDAQRAIAGGNRAALLTYGGPTMADPGLASRLAGMVVPTRVIWGDSDGMMTPDYGREFAAAIPGATFDLVRGAGHLPQIERPDAVLPMIWETPIRR